MQLADPRLGLGGEQLRGQTGVLALECPRFGRGLREALGGLLSRIRTPSRVWWFLLRDEAEGQPVSRHRSNQADGISLLRVIDDYRPITPADYPNIENVVKKAVKEKQNFERLELPKEALLEMFAVSTGCLCLGKPKLTLYVLILPVQQLQATLYQKPGS